MKIWTSPALTFKHFGKGWIMTQPALDVTQGDQEQPPEHLCQYCGKATYEDVVSLAVWFEQRLVVLSDVPVRVCGSCYEQYYDDSVAFYMDKLQGLHFPADMAKKTLEVPVYSLEDLKNA